MNAQVGTALSLHRTLREGTRGRDVERLQKRLAELGFGVGETDGLYGYKTKRAVEEIQRLLCLQQDGIVGRRTRALLVRPRLPIKVEAYEAKKGDTLKGVARQLDTTQDALLRASGIRTGRAFPLSEGQPLFAISRLLLGVCCGYLRPSSRGWAGPSTGTVFDITADGTLSQVEESEGLGTLVFRVSADAALLSDSSRLKETAKQIRLQAARTGTGAVLLVLPYIRGAIAYRLLTLLRLVRHELPSSRRLIVCVPVVDGKGGRQGSPALDLRLVLQSADYVVLMAWRESVVEGSAGFLAPLPWVARSVRAAVRSVAPWRVLMGICGCAIKRNPDTGEGIRIPYSEVARILSAYAATGDWDIESASPKFMCRRRGVDVEYIYENDWSIKLKAMLADRLNLGGIAIFDASWAHPDAMTRVEDVYKISAVESAL